MAGIQIGGLATGLDTNSLVQQLMAAESKPVQLLQTSKVKLQAQSTAYTDLNSKLLTMKDRADALADPATFFSRSVSSSDTGVATASASAGATRGTFSFTVTDLARGSIAVASSTKSSLTDTVSVGGGTFQFKLGTSGSVVSVPVDTTTTLDQLVGVINGTDSGVKASVVNAGTSQAPAWKLMLTSAATGVANDITVVHDDTSLGLANTQHATDAAFHVTGLGDFTRSTNTFSDVLDGVTVTLKGEGPTDLAVGYDSGATQSKIQSLLDAYNSVIKTIDGQTIAQKGNDGTLTPGAFTGDAATRQIRDALTSQIRARVSGSLTTLADIGITTNKDDGTLSLDSARFQRAMATDPDGVSALVAGTSTKSGIADLLSAKLDAATKSVTGWIAARKDGITASIRNLDQQIDEANTRLTTMQQMLQAKFTALEQTVSQLQQTSNSFLQTLQNFNISGKNSG